MNRPKLKTNILNLRKQTVIPEPEIVAKKPARPKLQIESCVPDPDHVNRRSETPAFTELEYAQDKGMAAIYGISDERYAFLMKHGYPAFKDCLKRGLEPSLDVSESPHPEMYEPHSWVYISKGRKKGLPLPELD